MLKLVEPLLGLPSVETQQRHRGRRPGRVRCRCSECDAKPGGGTSTSDWTRRSDHPSCRARCSPTPWETSRRGCRSVGSSARSRPARPSTDPATIPGMLKYSVYANAAKPRWSPPRVAARAVHRLTLREELCARARGWSCTGGVVRRGDLGTASTRTEDGQASNRASETSGRRW